MDVREKLVELLNEVQETGVNEIPAGFGCTREYVKNEKVASHLIAHGVTVQELDGCEYCKQFDDPWEAPMIAKEDDEPDRGIYLYNGFLCANGGEFVDAKVNFCPMCGRKLPQPPKGE